MTRTERTYYLVFALYNFSWSFIGPVYALFLLDRGLDLFQMSAVPAVYWIVSFVFEVPTGAFADLAGRKTAFLLSCVIRMVAFALYAYAGGFRDFVVAEFIDALGSTLANGALDAWAVDGMQGEGDARPADRFFARAQMVARTAIIAGGVAGGYLAQRDLTLPWLAAAGAFGLTSIVAAVWMHEVRTRPDAAKSARPSLLRTVGEGLRTVGRAPVLLLLCGLTFAVTFATMPTTMFWQPRMQALTGEGAWLMGWIWALLNLASIAGSALILRWLRGYGRERVLGLVVLWRGSMLAVMGLATGFGPALAGLLLMEMGFGVSEPLLQTWMNEHIAAAQRATVLSVRAMCLTLGGGLGLVCLGLVARGFGITVAWLVSAVILALTAPGFLILEGRARRAAASVSPHTATPASASVIPPAIR
jgi:MFS family permease